MEHRVTLWICVQNEDKSSSNGLGLRVDVHVLEQIAECERVDVYASEKGGG